MIKLSLASLCFLLVGCAHQIKPMPANTKTSYQPSVILSPIYYNPVTVIDDEPATKGSKTKLDYY